VRIHHFISNLFCQFVTPLVKLQVFFALGIRRLARNGFIDNYVVFYYNFQNKSVRHGPDWIFLALEFWSQPSLMKHSVSAFLHSYLIRLCKSKLAILTNNWGAMMSSHGLVLALVRLTFPTTRISHWTHL